MGNYVSIDKYKNLILDQAKLINSDKINKLLVYLESTDFYEAPASHNFHHSYEGGLLEHCCEVYINLDALSPVMDKDNQITVEDKFLMAFGHDLAKCNFYEIEQRNRNINGQWRKVDTYVYGDSDFNHEAESVYRLIKNVGSDINISVIKAIYYHHGAFNESTKHNFSDSCRDNNHTLILHTADMLSAIQGDKKMEIVRNDRGY